MRFINCYHYLKFKLSIILWFYFFAPLDAYEEFPILNEALDIVVEKLFENIIRLRSVYIHTVSLVLSIILFRFTQKGIENIKESPSRIDAIKQAFLFSLKFKPSVQPAIFLSASHESQGPRA